MVHGKLAGIFVCTLMVGAATFAMAVVPDLQESTAVTAFHGGLIHLYIQPDGGGNPFERCRYWDGAVSQIEDGTITLTLMDASLNPIAFFPREDLWLEMRDGGMAICPGGTIADADTDINGLTRWAIPLRGGGYSQDLMQVMVNGAALTSDAGLPIIVNSADINGSLVVELGDVIIFSGDFFGGYHYRSDFNYDTFINLLDVTYLAAAWGASCQ